MTKMGRLGREGAVRTGFLADQEGFLRYVSLLKHPGTNLFEFKIELDLNENVRSREVSFFQLFNFLNFLLLFHVYI